MSSRWCILAVLAVAACGSNGPSSIDAPATPPGDGDVPVGDGPVSTIDGEVPAIDAAPTPPAVGPACGAATCTNGQQDCCLGMTNTCKPAGTCPSQGFACDGPEDCAGTRCCFGGGGTGGSTCSGANNCAIACHDDGDCPASESKCCARMFTPGYKVCQPSC